MSEYRPASSTRPLVLRHFWPWMVFAPLSAVFAVLVITLFDPFGFESATKRQSARVFYKIYAAIYPLANRDKITLVMLDNRTLKGYRTKAEQTSEEYTEAWPPSHAVHNDVLSTIISLKPAAVLVDMLMVYRRENDHFARTKKTIEENNNKIPVFFAASAEWPPAREELVLLAQEKKIGLVSVEIEGDTDTPLYPLHLDRRTQLKPAALALYETVCQSFLKHCETGTIAGNARKMEVVWGLRPANWNCYRAALNPDLIHVCDDLESSLLERIGRVSQETLIPSYYRPADPMPVRYHATISTADLLDNSQAKRARIQPLIEGNVVIYGVGVPLVKDPIYSPVHGTIEGANVHAMALDNLLTFGSNYVHQSLTNETFHKELTELQPAMLMLVAALAIIYRRRRLLREFETRRDLHALQEADERFLVFVRRSLLIVATAAGLAEFYWGNISPFNWLALLIVVHIAHWMEKRFFGTVVREIHEWASASAQQDGRRVAPAE